MTTPPSQPAGRPPRAGWVRPLSVRIMVLGILTLGAFALLVPTVMRYLDQRAELLALERQLSTLETQNQQLTDELARWDDTSYVVAQARERLSYVFPGETAYRVIDPQSVPSAVVATDTEPVLTDPVADAATGDTSTWYANLWQSFEIAGSLPGASETDEEGTSGEPTG